MSAIAGIRGQGAGLRAVGGDEFIADIGRGRTPRPEFSGGVQPPASRLCRAEGISLACAPVRRRGGAAGHGAGADRHCRGEPPLSTAQWAAGARPRGRLARRGRPRIRCAARPFRLRQVDAAVSDWRLPPHRDRQNSRRGQAGRRARARSRHRLSTLCAVSVEDGARKHPLRSGTNGASARRTREAGAIVHRSCRPRRLRG